MTSNGSPLLQMLATEGKRSTGKSVSTVASSATWPRSTMCQRSAESVCCNGGKLENTTTWG
eukprot:5599621-Lingulodinium_polyedra.AAC.1